METFVLDAASPEAVQVRALLDSGTLVNAPVSIAADAATTDAAPGNEDDTLGNESDDGEDDDGTAGLPVMVSRTSTSAAFAGREPPKTSSRSPPSTMSSSAPTQDQDAVVRMREAAISHFMSQLFMTVIPGLMYIALSATEARVILLSRICVTVFLCFAGAFTARAVLPLSMRLALAPWWTYIAVGCLIMEVLGTEVALFFDFLRLAGPAACPDLRPSSCARVFFWSFHAPLGSLAWLMAQLPVTRVFFPELVRNALYVGLALHFAHQDGVLSPSYAFSVMIEGLGCAFITPIVFLLCYRVPDGVLAVLTDLETCPRMLRGYRSYGYSLGLSLRRRFFGDAVLLDPRTNILVAAFRVSLIYRLFVSSTWITLLDGCASLTHMLMVLVLVSAVSKAKLGALYDLDALAHEVKSAERAQALSLLRDRLAVAPSEAAILRAGCEAISELFPGGVAYAMAAFAESSACSVITVMHLLGEVPAQEALLSSLPTHVGAQTLAADGSVTSVARACHEAYGRPTVLDSREMPGGINACADWAAAVKAGLKSVHAATAPLNAGHVTVVRIPRASCFRCPCSDVLLRCRALCKCILAREAGRR
jgi:hypothetical protein